MKKNILHNKSIEEFHTDLLSGETSIFEVAEEVIENYNHSEASKSAFAEFNNAAIENLASSISTIDNNHFAFLGVPVSIKDLYGVNGYKTRAGTPKELPSKWEVQGPIVNTLTSHHSLITGKTHTVEFAFGGVGMNPHWGTPINPWDETEHRVPGGSSSGAGVSLCTGTAALALGTDTAGSVRIPASVTGNVGLKTTKNRWSTEGIVPLSSSFDTPGILTHTVKDCIYAFKELDKTSLYNYKDKELNVDPDIDFTFTTYDWFFDKCNEQISSEINTAIKKIESYGKYKKANELNEIDDSYYLFTKGGLAAAEFAAYIDGEMSELKETLDPNVAFRIKDMDSFSAMEYLERKNDLETMSRTINKKFEKFDVIITPTVPITAPAVSHLKDSKKYSEANGLMLRNTSPINLLGLCAITIPIALDRSRIPIGLQIIAPAFNELKLLSIALRIETSLGNKYKNLF